MLTRLSIEGGFRVIYERDVPLEMKITEAKILEMVGQDIGTKENIFFRILIRGDEEEPLELKIEIMSENDYFFLFRHQ